MSTWIQCCALEGFLQQVMQFNNGEAKWQLFKWNGNFRRIHSIADSSPNPRRFEEFTF